MALPVTIGKHNARTRQPHLNIIRLWLNLTTSTLIYRNLIIDPKLLVWIYTSMTHTKKEKTMLVSLFLPRSSIAVLKLPPLFILTSTRRANLHMDTVNYSAWFRKLFLVTKHLINTSLWWTLFNPKAPPRSSVCSEVNFKAHSRVL